MSSPITHHIEPADSDQQLQFLYGRIDYERALAVPYEGREFKLDRMRELLDRLDHPEAELPIVHIAGTKGKGSTAAMVSAMLAAAGYRAGMFTSPHVDRLEERIAVAGRPCTADELVDLIRRVRPEVEAIDRELLAKATAETDSENGPTYFEITTAMALLHFARRKVDAAILEVGMGGRLDSTNVCRPTVSVITSISLDHTLQLGDSLELIAREKAGIIKPGVPVVSGVIESEPRDVIREVCRREGCRLVELGVDFDYEYRPPRQLDESATAGQFDFLDRHRADGSRLDLPLRLLGRHQAANAAVALAVLDELRRAEFTISDEAIRDGLARVDWPARVEVVSRRPTVVIDMAHNGASVDALVRTLDESFSAERRFLIFATTLEKDVRGMLECLLPRFDTTVFTQYMTNPRAVPPETLASLADELTGKPHDIFPEPSQAWTAVRGEAGLDDLICITGSVFIASEMRRLICELPKNH